MLPGEDGQYGLLKRELRELEQDCDHYYKLYQEENKAKLSAQSAIATAIGQFREVQRFRCTWVIPHA